jgi:hypothetical protein
MADGQWPGQRLHEALTGEVVADIAEAARAVEAKLGVVADDATGFLAAMLQGVKPKGDEIGRVSEAYDAINATLLPQRVIVERVGGGHLRGQEWQLRILCLSLALYISLRRRHVTKLSHAGDRAGTLRHVSGTSQAPIKSSY